MTLDYVGIRVRDLDRSIAFYTETMGLTLLRRRQIEWTGGEIAMLKDETSGQMLELNRYPDATYRSGDELDHLGFAVEDVEEDLERLVEAGCRIVYPLEDRGDYDYACVTDPDGIWIELYASKEG